MPVDVPIVTLEALSIGLDDTTVAEVSANLNYLVVSRAVIAKPENILSDVLIQIQHVHIGEIKNVDGVLYFPLDNRMIGRTYHIAHTHMKTLGYIRAYLITIMDKALTKVRRLV